MFVRAPVEGEETKEQLIAVTEIGYGTVQMRREHIYLFGRDGALHAVESLPAWQSFAPRLAPDEGVWKDGEDQFGDGRMTFVFYIWKEGDRECCPTGGRVSGRYLLERADGAYRIGAKTYERRPYRHPGADGDAFSDAI